ncbi:MAG: aminotransferase class I/II-fold pyridoxal phosphate-dependent enzyme [Alphaproteobacteria bacterium]|nr:aminotransferase class I/II-fold pyridoxal phosphate-dependent enzyme [Alphaproteobacteria bacterium]
MIVAERFAGLPDYPFPRLRALLGQKAGEALPEGAIDLSIGEPRHGVPEFLARALSADFAAYGRYPPNEGTPAFRRAAAGWLARRYGLAPDFLDPDAAILPVNGTREALFLAAQLAARAETQPRPVVLLPNPFYQCYAAAAAAIGAEIHYVPATAETGFLPAFDRVAREVLDRAVAAYVCAPSNPQGAIADLAYWRRLLALAERHDFLLFADECYAEIYDGAPPTGVVEACAGSPAALERVLAFHSLSKRSNLPGLRSGFVVGGEKIVTAFRVLRSYGGAPSPIPVLEAATQAWSDEAHVVANRTLYRAKIDVAERILGNRFAFRRPPGGFFLWLDVGDGERAARDLWSKAKVKVLPGAYLATEVDGVNPGAPYIRVALVDSLKTTQDGLERIAATL